MTEQTHMLLVPHTHWDREWYLTFQQFRMRLVRVVDKVLDVLESDPAFTHFTLDGQTIVLEDYLEVRPENAERLRALARAGRLLVGPWYLQPDEFLVGGESLIRNLHIGKLMAEPYGGAMPVGYVPDTFGHISQLPQILRGFGLDNAVFWRGVPPEIKPGPFRWRAPDGSEVLVIWLCDEFGYSNAANIPPETDGVVLRLSQIGTRMRAHGGYTTLLAMNGTDHMEPQAGLPRALEGAASQLRQHGLAVTIGTLPQFVALVREAQPNLPVYSGEMRSSYSAHLLPGVLSTRIWLKQRNAAAESLLTHWTEPAAAWAWLMGDGYQDALLALSWKLLLQNHPHDSICGCGIDQVHREMITRFDQSEQIAQEVTKQALDYLTMWIDTRGPEESVPFVVFNPASGPRTDAVRCDAQLPFSGFEVVDAEGHVLPYQHLSAHAQQLFDQEVDKNLVLAGIGMVSEGRAMGYVLMDARVGLSDTPGTALVELTIAEHGDPDPALLERAKTQTLELALREDITTFRVIAREAKHTELLVQVRDVPARGGRVLFIKPREAGASVAAAPGRTLDSQARAGEDWLENAHLRVEVDSETGSLTLHDKRTGRRYTGLNQLVDGGDVGDLYTYCPPAQDELVTRPVRPPHIEVKEAGPVRATLRVVRGYALPAACAADRTGRSSERVDYAVTSDVSLVAGARRVEITTTVENTARDHRLRVLFPVPFVATCADAEGVFDVTTRLVTQPKPSTEEAESWAELPVDTHPQKRFVDIHDAEHGLAVLNHGLPEYEIVPGAGGQASAIALTLLRCVEWLSREDLSTRRGHAGPKLFTPDAQGLATHVFEYALVPHVGTWTSEDALVLREAEAFEESMRALATERHFGQLRDMWSFVHVAPASIAVSAVKRSARGDGLIVRLYNPSREDVATELILALPFREVVEVNLNEVRLSDAEARDLARILSTGVRTTVRAGEIVTLLFRVEEPTAETGLPDRHD